MPQIDTWREWLLWPLKHTFNKQTSGQPNNGFESAGEVRASDDVLFEIMNIQNRFSLDRRIEEGRMKPTDLMIYDHGEIKTVVMLPREILSYEEAKRRHEIMLKNRQASSETNPPTDLGLIQ